MLPTMRHLKWKINRWLMFENVYLVHSDTWFDLAMVELIHGIYSQKNTLILPAITEFCELRARWVNESMSKLT